MKIVGLVVYAAHKWRDKIFFKKHKPCEHSYKCPCKVKLLQSRKVERPFQEHSIRRPMKIDNKIVQHNAQDTETLIKVGLHISTIMCADHLNNPVVPKNLSNYTDSEMRMNNAYCKAYNG